MMELVEETMDYSEAGDRVGIGHESIGTTLDSVKFNGALATDHAPDRPEALAGIAPTVMNRVFTLG